MDLRTRKVLNRVVFGGAMLFVFVVVGAGGSVGVLFAIPVTAIALPLFLIEEYNLRARTPRPAEPPRPPRPARREHWDAPSPAEERARREKREAARKEKR